MKALNLLLDVTMFTKTYSSSIAYVYKYIKLYFCVAAEIQSHALFSALDTPVTLVYLALPACQGQYLLDEQAGLVPGSFPFSV